MDDTNATWGLNTAKIRGEKKAGWASKRGQ
jgi:hypothetical protein